MSGEDAASLFYDEERFERTGVAPLRVQETLFGRGGVQGMDDLPHRRRKEMFLSLMSVESIARLADLSDGQWRAYATRWAKRDQVVLFDEACEILCRAVCVWAGVPLAEADVQKRTRDFVAMIEAGAAVGPRHWRGRLARNRTEGWIGGLVNQVRAQSPPSDEGDALQVIARHRDAQGRLLNSELAAVGLINLLRPTVAIAWYVTFAALALYQHPECRARLLTGEAEYREWFVQEVRRYYPFFPAVAARTRKEFDWKGYHFPHGTRVLLDLYGTDHDARLWERPDVFLPERFRHWNRSAFNFVPQGGGEHRTGHRCPGEWITIELMKGAVAFMSAGMHFDVPQQDLRINLSRIPTIPKSRFVIKQVRLNSRGERE
ncbi:cytochrome P450 [Pollutimonas sp. H1-120]|uniref:cytochrome P450 n=1 Tax=Pollutimonas sp. H1-120 TaxID=3148824 RepID=UPI003B52AE1D